MAAAAVALIVPGAASAWTWPVGGPVLRGFLFSEDNPLAPGQHRGVDVQGALGEAVVAPIRGTVTFVGRVAANGLTVTIVTPDGYTVTLLHLGDSLVTRGAVVDEGQPVAIVGTSGVPEYSVPYVQLGVRLTSDPEGYLDPQAFLPPPAPPSVPPPPAPAPDSQPAPALPPTTATPPPAVAPPTPADRVAARAPHPVSAAPDRPLGQPDALRAARPAWHPSASASSAVHEPHVAADSTETVAALTRHPLDANPTQTAAASLQAPARSQPPSPRTIVVAPAMSWVRPLDPVVRLAVGGAPHADHGAPGGSRDVIALLVGLVAACCLCAYEFGRRAARIIGGDALLPDNADLLRELEPAHRARVHDDRRGRARPTPQAAR